MKQNKQIKNWWIDALMFVGYLFCFYLEFTGVIGHEWLGVGIGILAIMHTWLHWDWVVLVTRRFFSCAGARSRWYYLVDILILIGFVVILETGLVISTWLNLDLLNYVTWLDIHLYASYATLALLVLKVGIHWHWVINITGRIFGTQKRPASIGGLTPLPVPDRVDKGVVDRRRFIGLMGVVGVGSLLAVINVVRENSIFTDTGNSNVSAMDVTETMSADQSTIVEPATPPATDAAEKAAVTSESDTTTPMIETTATAQPTMVPTQADVAACQVRCPKGCSFPGRCRRYEDQNSNGMCDLGECL